MNKGMSVLVHMSWKIPDEYRVILLYNLLICMLHILKGIGN
jgi:hypothetical protein